VASAFEAISRTGYHACVIASGTVLAALALLQAQAVDQIVVTTAPSMDAQRLADALRVYLDEFGIRVETRAAGEADDLRKRIDDARQLGEALRAVAVVRAEHGARGSVEIELVDLATDKVLVVSVPRPERDEDLYRALALKIQAVLRATLSEARAELDPRSSLGRLVAEPPRPPPSPPPVVAATPPVTASAPALALDAGYGFVSFPDGGPSFGGLAVRGAWRPRHNLELALGTAALGSASASNGTVAASATIVPVHATVRRSFSARRAQVLVGPCVDATYVKVSASSTTTPVRAARNVMVGLGGEVEGRVAILTSAWLFARAAVLGVFNGERYDVAGTPLFDTSHLQVSGTVGAGIGLP
jgi:hypothetical protein